MPVVNTGFPTLQTLMNLARVHVNDTFRGATQTPGEGRVLTNDSPFAIPCINDALSDYSRELDNSGVPTLFKETFMLNFPPVNSILGAGIPNATVQQELSYTGFFDGLVSTTDLVLPADLLSPKRMWYRASNTGQPFYEFLPAPAGLQSYFQGLVPGMWDWRGNSIFWNGAVQPIDIRMRYNAQVEFYGVIDPTDFADTALPFRDCVSVLALMVAEKFCAARLPAGATADLGAKIKYKMDQVINRQVKKAQTTTYSRRAFGDEECGGGWA